MENKENRGKNKLVAGIIIAVLAIGLIVLGVIFVPDLYQKSLLLDEVEQLSKMDITADDFNLEIKTTGEYAKVEEAVKEYFVEFSGHLQTAMGAISEENLDKIMTEENLKNEAPGFENVLANITTVRETFNTSMDELIKIINEEAIMAKIEAKNVDEKYKELYKELMFDEEIMEQLEEQKQELEASKILLNDILDSNEQIYRLLAENPGKWKYDETGMQIDDEELLEKYNAIITDLNTEE